MAELQPIRLGIVVPALNEERSIGELVQRLRFYGEVIVVNDASTDATERVALENGAVIVSHVKCSGYDGALNSGFARAAEMNLSHVITMDADGQHPSELVPQFAAAFSEGFELVLGVRHKSQRVSERIFALYTQKRFGASDPLCGMKGYSLRLYRSVGYFDSYHSIGTELAMRSLAARVNFREIPFHCSIRAHGRPRFGSLVSANLRILRAMLKAMAIRS